MKKIILLFCAIALASCSGDDDGSSKKMVPTSIVISNTSNPGSGQAINLTYDSKHRISSMIVGDGGTVVFHYANDTQLSDIQSINGNSTITTTVTYDSKGRISAFGSGTDSVPIVYNDNGTLSLFDTTVGFNDAKDIAYYGNTTISYDSAKKGPFANVKAYSQLLLLLLDSNAVLYATKKPVTAVGSTDNSISTTLQNTYNDEGYVTSATVSGGGVITYTYDDL